MTSTVQTCDIAIIGGGLVGASLAVALAPLNLRIVLIEAATPPGSAPSWDERCIALNAASQQIVASLGLWDALAPSVEPIRSTHISERGRFGVARFTAEQAGLPALGYNVPMRALGAVFAEAAVRTSLQTLAPARLRSLQPAGDAAHLIVELAGGPAELHAQLVIAADGARSTVRELLGIGAASRDYQQSAIVTAVRPQRAHGGVAYERFMPSGPLAVLPKPDDAQGHACSLVWTVATEQCGDYLALSDADFLAAAEDAFGERLGRFAALGRRAAYPLERVISERISAPRVLFLGNAAQSLHPVAAQGFNLGLRDVATLAEVLAEPGDRGASERLARYEAQRESDRARVAGFTDGLVRVFSNAVPGLRSLRHLGLLALDLTPPLKQAVLQQNLGYGSAVPPLARRRG
ncbi:MAG: 2-octaprenyl-6-methoxyphenyl hydroxylase [Hydrocarboniphaga sp.]|uniref:2-octaprenyl-6-methoxyphenyl hydroxylase n=1 Tax=Hydrocarboniphaga sp. TaxID=2033016 RepID=UPI0026381302|nr:2-octaprenyl-6-methoxyphenyl hydroxylase [Hydrocarboniphaga sp.]MDB5971331.1 2-octaprenyl-6-methoxyphenyl hydroxylase [Hydrocarboniphaga sp.]